MHQNANLGVFNKEVLIQNLQGNLEQKKILRLKTCICISSKYKIVLVNSCQAFYI